MDEIVKDFLIESNENLDRLDQELVKLETDPSSKELLASIFRTIHTIKGSCGFLGFARLEKLTHAGENLLSRLRDSKLSLTEEITSGLLAMVDAVRQMLYAIQSSGEDGNEDRAPLIAHLGRLQQPQATRPATLPVTLTLTLPATLASADALLPRPPSAPVETTGSAPIQNPSPDAPLKIEESPTERAQEFSGQDQPSTSRAADRNPDATPESIRVGVTLLDRLMNLVGELVLARNQLLQFSNSTQDVGFQALSQRMNLIASELREEVMRTRMQPIGNLWSKFPRTVRDLALSCGKEVRVEMEGKETELDRTIIEAIKDPLTHLVRNSVDHGIESPEDRKKAGKDPTGRLVLRAFHEGGQVNIEISDDGSGLNVERIRSKAIERGLVAADQAARMPDRDIFNLIFLPGFSTVEKVSNVSGRGVGMDVVKTNVEKIGGTVDVHSTPGKGTTVKVKIPLTLAIIPALVVRCNGERFAIPQISLTELVRLESGRAIERVHGAPVYRLRGQLLPLVYLSQTLDSPQRKKKAAKPQDPVPGAESKATTPQNVNIVVLQAEGRQFGLVVDDILDTEEIVVKPLEKQLKGISAYSGATIMGDGRVVLILDVMGLAQLAKLIAQVHDSVRREQHYEISNESSHADHALLLAENGLEGRVAIPLSLVARLEEFPRSVIERAGSQEVMQYRGQIVPLVRLSSVIPATSDAEILANANSIQVVVYAEGKRTMGLIVDRIVDIVEEPAAIESLTPRSGVVGSFVTQSLVTDLLDLPAIMRAALPGLLDAAETQAGRT